MRSDHDNTMIKMMIVLQTICCVNSEWQEVSTNEIKYCSSRCKLDARLLYFEVRFERLDIIMEMKKKMHQPILCEGEEVEGKRRMN